MAMKSLRIYQDGGWWMECDGDLTDDLIYDSEGKWVAAFFPTLQGGHRCVLTNRTDCVAVFLCGHVEHRAISSGGAVALVAYGSGPTPRLEILRRDGMAARLAADRHLRQATALHFSADGTTATVETPRGARPHVLSTLPWRRSGKMERVNSARASRDLPKWAVWTIFSGVAGFFLLLAILSL